MDEPVQLLKRQRTNSRPPTSLARNIPKPGPNTAQKLIEDMEPPQRQPCRHVESRISSARWRYELCSEGLRALEAYGSKRIAVVAVCGPVGSGKSASACRLVAQMPQVSCSTCSWAMWRSRSSSWAAPATAYGSGHIGTLTMSMRPSRPTWIAGS